MMRVKWFQRIICMSVFLAMLLGLPSSAKADEIQLLPHRQPGPEDYGYDWEEKVDKRILETRSEVVAALNERLWDFEEHFLLTLHGDASVLLPTSLYELERHFVESIRFYPLSAGKETVKIRAEVTYNEGGKLLAALRYGTDLPDEPKVAALAEVALPMVQSCAAMTEWERAVTLHDALVNLGQVSHGDYDKSTTAYIALVEKKGTDESYAEALQLLYSLAGLESRVVYGRLNNSPEVPHLFNKVKVDGEWYNVSAILDDREYPHREVVGHGHCMVNDRVMAQRYHWERGRYPAATGTDNAWYDQRGETVASQAGLERQVRAQLAAGKKTVMVWIDDYSSADYDFGFAKALNGEKQVRISYVEALPRTDRPVATEVIMLFSE